MSVQPHQQREFEEILIEVLAQDHDLPVCHAEDALERRRRGMACLKFDYQTGKKNKDAKVVVSIEGAPSFSNMLPVDFSSPESMTRSAEDCEALALFLMEYLEDQEAETLSALDAGDLDYGRREEDLY